jgi:hypothetical protein
MQSKDQSTVADAGQEQFCLITPPLLSKKRNMITIGARTRVVDISWARSKPAVPLPEEPGSLPEPEAYLS